ncbi:hypothetical protein [Paraburkholderia acidisoli]|uniref:Uncharacterized protein n=1 Tax=Paraburkholderia acidisoli TaxID=2571748 RepID=A0A7Z2GN71_9BURK|nr:hypothetical protein [Paraburkholderia acidisoli]QGZ64877.1 hypothetical protein FAZ98_24005 [Paraburkholderia acidisoli]
MTPLHYDLLRRDVHFDIAHFDLTAMTAAQKPAEGDDGAQPDREGETHPDPNEGLPELPDPVEVGEDG